MTIYVKNSYLCHHGVLGMKWGIRRYQNPDGSLTEAGKQHELKVLRKSKTKELRRAQRRAARAAGKAYGYSTMKNYYDEKKRIADEKYAVTNKERYKRKSDKYEKRSDQWKTNYDNVIGDFKNNREAVRKVQDFVSKNSNLMISYRDTSTMYTGSTKSGGIVDVWYSKGTVRERNDKNVKKYAGKQTEKAYKFVETYYNYYCY